ncbi:MAG: sulfatase-like hydrolase/transferase [Lentisphaeria bacterium]|nr:sulfatase-like hydrolase/transferase [Lentisphaeria bacterium]
MPIEMSRRDALLGLGTGLALGLAPTLAAAPGKRPPNVIIIFTDDQGYADAGCYGATGYETPHLDRMAAEGVRFTDFYSPYASCSPSRAGLLTGCYPPRVGINGVLSPNSLIGLNPEETTIADMLKPLGYATSCIGKWHIGHHPEFLPRKHGFDEFFGLPYSNDMWPVHYDGKRRAKSHYPPLPLIENEKTVETIETLEQQGQLTTRYTERAVDFIRRNRRKPFFLYLAHSMVHVPIAVSEKFRGKSKQGLFGDVVMELDWSVGRILSTLAETGLDEDTLVVFTSDNGPWLNYGNHAGSVGPLRGGKGNTFEGGQREIGLMRWPGVIPAGVVQREPASAIDLLPTIAEITGAALPKKKIDGASILPLLKALPGARTPHEALFQYYGGGKLQAVRAGRWKLHFPHHYRQYEGFKPGADGFPGRLGRGRIEWSLFDLQTDVGERRDVAANHPDIVARLRRLGEEHTREMHANARPPGRRPGPPPEKIRTVATKPVLIQADKDGMLLCHARNARILNPKGARYVESSKRQNIGSWHSLETAVSWQVEVPTAGVYRVLVTQSLARPLTGGVFRVVCGAEAAQAACKTTPSWSSYARVDTGMLYLPAGRAELRLEALKLSGGRCLMNLKSVTLIPQEKNAP